MADEPEVANDTPQAADVLPFDAQGAEGDAQPTEQEAAPATPPAKPAAPTWDAQPLPEGHWGLQKGYKTFGDWNKAHEALQKERDHVTRTAQEQREVIAPLLKRLKELEAASKQPAQAPQQQQAQPQGYFGFRDKAAFDKAYQIDPEAALSKMLESRAKPLVEESIKPVQTQLEEIKNERAEWKKQQALLSLKTQSEEMASRYADAKTGPMQEATSKFIGENPWVGFLIESLPNEVNKPEIVFKLASYDLLKAKLDALEKKMEPKRAAASVARPGTGGKSVPKNETPQELTRRIAAQFEGVTQTDIEAAEALFK